MQGPFVLPAALSLHASVPRTAMGVAMAQNVSNMMQPFWAVPIVAIAGIRIQRGRLGQRVFLVLRAHAVLASRLAKIGDNEPTPPRIVCAIPRRPR